MKRIIYLPVMAFATVLAITSSCSNKRSTGRVYIPDMAYSRAYETYTLLDSSLFVTSYLDSASVGHKIFYNTQPVNGTIKRGEMFPYTLPNDSIGYIKSAEIKNPLGPLSTADSLEASRLFNINCAVCHGATGVANGPLTAKIGAIANLTQPLYIKMADGTMFHSITYGKNNMGSYASQLDRKQRWMLVQYIRTLQPKAKTSEATTDSASVKK